MTDRHPDKQNGMTIRLTLCERDASARWDRRHCVPRAHALWIVSDALKTDAALCAIATVYSFKSGGVGK